MTHDELRRLAEAAYEGPWWVSGQWPQSVYRWDDPEDPEREAVTVAYVNGGSYRNMQATAEFIAAARNALPGLLDEIDRLRSNFAALEALRSDLPDHTEREAFSRAFDEVRAERDALRAKVERVRRALAETEIPQWDDGDSDWIENPAGVLIDVIRRALDGGSDE